ncbi:Uncharacterised protein [Vibrio cholerae]|nr:Uncharacterised protein [Vibrio cholerae]CSI37993.1 Uncharacterised protein [Vibrio cholerae]CSI65929.1 Uncharacterised protein [Vibrio cholerae]
MISRALICVSVSLKRTRIEPFSRAMDFWESCALLSASVTASSVDISTEAPRAPVIWIAGSSP